MEKTITLYYKQGKTDKVYIANLSEDDNGYVVTFAYGRRGKPLRSGQKTTKPVPYEKALEIYAKLVHAKQLKGYTESEESMAFADNPNAGRDTGFRPQLLNSLDYEGAKDFLEEHGEIIVQVKHDGERRGVHLVQEEKPIFSNRKGQEITLSNPEIIEACQQLIRNRPKIRELTLDCEDMGNQLVIFDILQVDDNDLRGKSFAQRALVLSALRKIILWENLVRYFTVDCGTVVRTQTDLDFIIQETEKRREEGIVLRNPKARYRPGRPNSGGDCMKLKYTASATVQVYEHTPNKRSVGIAVRSGISEMLPIGKVTIPPNYTMPRVGDLVEVEYLYIHHGKGASLFQPQYKGLRSDKSNADSYNSLKFKKS